LEAWTLILDIMLVLAVGVYLVIAGCLIAFALDIQFGFIRFGWKFRDGAFICSDQRGTRF